MIVAEDGGDMFRFRTSAPAGRLGRPRRPAITSQPASGKAAARQGDQVTIIPHGDASPPPAQAA